MSVDLATRLRGYGDVLDSAIEFDLAHDIEMNSGRDHAMVPLARQESPPRRKPLVAVAAAAVLIGGCLALLIDHRSEPQGTASESDPGTATLSPSPSTALPTDDPSTWDPIRIAPGTVGWYEFDDVPAELAPLVGAIESWTTDYTARFYRCATYTVDADGAVCTRLLGGNFVAPTTFGGTDELGTHLGNISTADLAWTLAQGSLWGYDEVTTPPPPTPVEVGDHAGLVYSNAETSYLVWEQAPGVHLWIRATDVSIDDMVGLALTVRPATLPDHLPLPIIVDTVTTSGAPSFDELVIGSHHGIAQCVQINVWDGCAALPPTSEVAIVVGTDGVGGPLTAVAAVFPIDSPDRLQVVLDGYPGPITVAPVVSPLGFQYSIFRAGNQQITAAHVVGPDDSIVATATLSTVPTGPTPTTVEQPFITPEPGSVHPEEGSYVIVRGDYPSTIAHDFKVKFEDLLAINGWTLVGQIIPEFPQPGTTIKIPPGWTEPETEAGNSAGT